MASDKFQRGFILLTWGGYDEAVGIFVRDDMDHVNRVPPSDDLQRLLCSDLPTYSPRHRYCGPCIL